MDKIANKPMNKVDQQNRAEIGLILSNDGKWFHFTSLMQSAGTNNSTPTKSVVGGKVFDLWFRVTSVEKYPFAGPLFESVEEVLVWHGIANNLTDLVQQLGGSFVATYNERTHKLRGNG